VVERRVNHCFENHLRSRHHGNGDGSRNIGLLAVQPPEVAATPGKFQLITRLSMCLYIASRASVSFELTQTLFP